MMLQNGAYPELPKQVLGSIIDGNMSRKWSSLRMLGSQKVGQPDRVKWEVDAPDNSEFLDSLIGWYPQLGTITGTPPIYIDSCIDVYVEEEKRMKTDTDTQNKIRAAMSKDPTFAETWSFRDSTLWCNRHKPSHCPNCNVQHDNDNTLYFNVDSVAGHIYQCCIRSKNRIIVSETTCSDAPICSL
jgi:hypothetical protein